MLRNLFLLIIFIFVIKFSFLIFINDVKASDFLPVVSVINPIRGNELGLEDVDLLTSLKKQWEITKKHSIPATWLWQFSTLENEDLISYAKNQMYGQEFGLFLEIDRNTATKSKVLYRGRGPWYFSDGLFLHSYDQAERRKILDKSFSLFFNKFGYYPKTVGAWWLTSDTLNYVHHKYGVVAALRAADQFDLDVYSIWGTPWSVPYMSSKYNALVPAKSVEDSSGIVIMQWASRDPVEGYGRTDQSTYSYQDYFLQNRDTSYFKYLLENYLKSSYDHAVIGVEGGYLPKEYEGDGYAGLYRKNLEVVDELRNDNKLIFKNASSFAKGFISKEKTIQRNFLFMKSYVNNDQSFWYQSPFMRVGIRKNQDKVYLVDLRDYINAESEEFSFLPNSQGYLRVSTPAIIDSIRNNESKILLDTSSSDLSVIESNGDITLLSGSKKIAEINENKLNIYPESISQNYSFYKIKKLTYLSIFLIIVFITITYYLYLLFYKKILFKDSIHLILLMLPIIIYGLFFSQSITNPGLFFFDTKQVILSPLLALPLFDLENRILILFTFIPFISLIIAHYLMLIRRTSKKLLHIFLIYYIGILLLYTRIPYFPIDSSTYIYLFIIFGLIGVIGIAFSIILFIKSKSKKRSFSILVVTGITMLILSIIIVFSRTSIVLTSFELEALKHISKNRLKVIYLLPSQSPIYKGIKPILYDNHNYAELLTSVPWETVTFDEKNNYIESKETQILVPRYLGSDLAEDRINALELHKIFDNGNIVIYKKTK